MYLPNCLFRANNNTLQAVFLEPAIHRTPAKPQLLRRTRDAAITPLKRLLDQVPLNFFKTHVLEPLRSGGGRGQTQVRLAD